ncbi:ribosome small subunit-dependent GTPase A, partial [Streptomyces rubiginosohelvolus]
MSQFSYHHHDQPYSLADYGWDEAWDHAFAPCRGAGLIPARVVRAERGSCEAVTDAGILHAEIPGGAEQVPTTGDWAALLPATTSRGPVLHTVLERRTSLVRSTASRTSQGQVLAANVDTVVVAVSLAVPRNHGRTERMLAL